MPDDITSLLHAAAEGDRHASDRAFGLLYDSLRNIACARLSLGGDLPELHVTALVHEAYLRVRHATGLDFPDRKHFLAYASRVMRSVVVDRVRSRLAERHGGGSPHTAFDTAQVEGAGTAADEEVLHVHEGLQALAAAEPRLAQVVELRYFVGLNDAEIAALLDITERTVQRDWRKARLFLATALQ